MQRTIEQWKNCRSHEMANNQSNMAKFYAFRDAKADILELHDETVRLKKWIVDCRMRVLHELSKDNNLRYEDICEDLLRGSNSLLLAKK